MLQINIENYLQSKFKRAMPNKKEPDEILNWFLSHFDRSSFYNRSDNYSAQSMAPISERRQRNSNNWKHRPGISKSVAMRIAYDWFFDTRIDSSGPTISNSIGWSFLCGQCQATPYIPSMPASITYWRDRLKLKLILIARLSRVAISFRAGPRIWACAWPPTEKAPLESVLYCCTPVSVTLELEHGPAWSCQGMWRGE